MFCSNCGAEVSEKAIVCLKCGAGVNQNTARPTPPPIGTEPKSWLVESILVTLFCCLPFGIIGIISAADVSSRFLAGDMEGAERASKQAGKWAKIGFWTGIACITAYILFYVVFAGIAIGSSVLSIVNA